MDDEEDEEEDDDEDDDEDVDEGDDEGDDGSVVPSTKRRRVGNPTARLRLSRVDVFRQNCGGPRRVRPHSRQKAGPMNLSSLPFCGVGSIGLLGRLSCHLRSPRTPAPTRAGTRHSSGRALAISRSLSLNGMICVVGSLSQPGVLSLRHPLQPT